MSKFFYCSTRSGADCTATFEEALFSGYAPDGGLYVPSYIPDLDKGIFAEWSKLSFTELVFELLKMFVPESEVPRNDLKNIATRAFLRFDCREIVTLKKLKSNLNVLELFHGPTLAFKDIALCVVGQFMSYFLKKRQKHATILVGTSGDTGSAAIESVRGVMSADIIVLLPRDRCSKLQELQMTTVNEPNVHVYRVDGTSDDLDAPIKRCFSDSNFVHEHNLCSINSINWCRIMVQTAYYFYAYFQAVPSLDKTLEVVVPTGALGNATAGVISRRLGLPIRLVCAVNVNDIVARTINTGNFTLADAVVPTLAPAMDIQFPYNMERLLYIFSNYKTATVRNVLEAVEAKRHANLPTEILHKLQEVISSYSVNDDEIKTTMRRCWEENAYLLCPHTATAGHYHYTHPTDAPRVCIATASPAKFTEALLASGLEPLVSQKLQKLLEQPTYSTDMEKEEDWDKVLQDKIKLISLNQKQA